MEDLGGDHSERPAGLTPPASGGLSRRRRGWGPRAGTAGAALASGGEATAPRATAGLGDREAGRAVHGPHSDSTLLAALRVTSVSQKHFTNMVS